MDELIALMQKAATQLDTSNESLLVFEQDYADTANELRAKISDLREYGYELYAP